MPVPGAMADKEANNFGLVPPHPGSCLVSGAHLEAVATGFTFYFPATMEPLM